MIKLTSSNALPYLSASKEGQRSLCRLRRLTNAPGKSPPHQRWRYAYACCRRTSFNRQIMQVPYIILADSDTMPQPLTCDAITIRQCRHGGVSDEPAR